MSYETIRLDLSGSYVVSCDKEQISIEVKRGSVVGKMARHILKLGYAPETLVVVYRNLTLCFHPAPISKWAETQVVENDHTFNFTKFQALEDYSYE